ncbi:MAG: hypothetical protein LBG74_02040 [Spirochaetaceae bacterium]|jgi:hypothetical protein|nr:hypothetical protein [Spirochaetaceae bacterium]
MKRFFAAILLVFSFPYLGFAKDKKEKKPSPENIVIIEQDIKDKNIKRELDRLTRVPKREFFFDLGVNRLEYQEIQLMIQEWKWFESTLSTPSMPREEVLDTRLLMYLISQGFEYTLNTGYIFNRFLGAGISLSAPFFPFIERDNFNVLPLFRADIFPYMLLGCDVARWLNLSLALGPHIGYYDYKQIMENPNEYNQGLSIMRYKNWAIGVEAMAQARFNISNHFYLGLRVQVAYEPFALIPEVEKLGAVSNNQSGNENEYHYYFFGSLMVKYGIYAGWYMRFSEQLYRKLPVVPQKGKAAGDDSL